MQNLSINTHDYDSKLREDYKKFIIDDDLNLIKPLDFKETLDEIYLKITQIPIQPFTNNAIITINYIFKDRKNNYDITNDINFEDLLTRTWRFLKYYEDNALYIFLEQLSEILTSGKCAQGRVVRIFQFYSNHMETKDYIYKKCKKI